MKLGVYLQNGPQDFQILQQHNGCADIPLSGFFCGGSGLVYIRAVEEDSGCVVCPWQVCKTICEDRWEGELHAVPAGGLYRIETCLNQDGGARMEWSTRGDMRHYIGVGDVFVIAGQSNAVGYGRDAIYDPPELGVHLLRSNMRWSIASHPLNDSTDTRHSQNRENTNPGHSPFLRFGKLLKKSLGYPIGLVQAAHGGSKLAEWDPAQDGSLLQNMLSVTESIGHDIKAVIWSQGCGDAAEPLCNTYLERFTSFVHALREAYGESLPILTMQINHAADEGDKWRCWSNVKEAQRQAAQQIPNLSVLPTNDLSLCDRIHNSSASNVVFGQRLALHALYRLYGKAEMEAPNVRSAKLRDADTLVMDFEHVQGRLYAFEVPADELAVKAEDECGRVSVPLFL